MTKEMHWLPALRDVGLLLLGSALYAFGLNAFLVPSGLVAGGIAGLATISHALFGLPIGLQTIAANAILIAYVFYRRSRDYLVRCLAGILAANVMTDLMAPFVTPLAEGDLLLAALVGGAVFGVGLGLVFRSGGNTGGIDIVAQSLSRRTGFGVGSITIMFDGIVILLSIPVFSVQNALYAVVCLYVSGVVTDAVVDGPRTVRCAYIISTEHEAIAQMILHSLRRGCTELSARGMFTGEDRPMLLCVLSLSEVSRLKHLVANTDPNAIVIISDVHEAFGEGFKYLGE